MTNFVKLYRSLFHETIQIYICKPRCLSQVSNEQKPPPHDQEPEETVYTKRDDDFKINRTATIKRLVGLLGINQFEAIDLASKHKALCETTGVQLSENYKSCLNHGLKNKTIQKCVDILSIRDLPARLSLVAQLGAINDLAPLLRLPPKTLLRFKSHFSVYHLARLLKVSPFQISEAFVQKPFLHSMKTEKISQIVQLLNENNITGPMIANDLTTLKYSLKTIQSRIEFAKECNVTELKTWMIRVDPTIFHHYIQIRSDSKKILGDKSVAEYLSKRLDCSLAGANYLVDKLPPLNTKSVKKMAEIIDYLYAQGFTPMHICRVPKILLHSFETTKKRLEKLYALRVEVNSLYVLIKSQNSFNQYYEALEKSVKKRQKVQETG